MFTVVVIHLIDGIIKAIREKNPKPLIPGGVIVVLILGSILIFNATVGNANFLPYDFDFFGLGVREIPTLISAVFPNILVAGYTPLFILLGVLWYYARNRIVQEGGGCGQNPGLEMRQEDGGCGRFPGLTIDRFGILSSPSARLNLAPLSFVAPPVSAFQEVSRLVP
jgi:hypothetical protein